MKWRKTKNPDLIDRRGASGGGGGFGSGGGFPIPIPGGGKSAGGLGIVGVIIFLVLQFAVGGSGGGSGFDIPGAFGTAPAPGTQEPAPLPPGQDPEADLKDFTSFVHKDVQDFWSATFSSQGKPYEPAKLILYRDGVNTGGCGSASSSVGPFYCPADQSAYIDLAFYDDMSEQLQASGDFAWAYVIAHEMGHHIQQLLGTSDQVQQASQSNSGDANELSVRLELQADCYSGVWAKSAFAEGAIEPGDIEEAQNAASAVGDDRLAQGAGRSVNPDNFTHGTSEQRQKWFTAGYDSGDPGACDTFSPDEP